MIKHLLMFAICFATIAAFAVTPKDFAWNTTDAAKLDAYRASSEELNKGNENQLKSWRAILLSMKELATKDATNMTYADFKKTISAACAKEGYLADKILICQLSYCIARFNPFCKDIFFDKDITYGYKYVYNAMRCYKAIPIIEFRELAINIINSNINSLNIVKAWVGYYKARAIEIDNADMLKDLKMIKKIIYSQINKGDNWKSVVVEVELMIKSIE